MPVSILALIDVVNLLVQDDPALLIDASAVSIRVCLVQNLGQLLHVCQVNVEQPFEPRPLDFDYYTLPSKQSRTVHL